MAACHGGGWAKRVSSGILEGMYAVHAVGFEDAGRNAKGKINESKVESEMSHFSLISAL